MVTASSSDPFVREVPAASMLALSPADMGAGGPWDSIGLTRHTVREQEQQTLTTATQTDNIESRDSGDPPPVSEQERMRLARLKRFDVAVCRAVPESSSNTVSAPASSKPQTTTSTGGTGISGEAHVFRGLPDAEVAGCGALSAPVVTTPNVVPTPMVFAFEVDDEVEAKCPGWGDVYYPAKILQQLPDGGYYVGWRDEPTGSPVAPEAVRTLVRTPNTHLEFAVGARVEARWGRDWFAGKILRRMPDGNYLIDWEDEPTVSILRPHDVREPLSVAEQIWV
eukprot:gnl/TRDRNA2_/TRDRNA2_167118_c0_seq1.p1 gnl/TRDRNA2_/TRDRNA2_167118_c0~~gnl/TRDRNA2_/TRDRNA2_167118_c0_seq1.p1  ORF type:complete len:281 (+),score=39.60 gnl/TRDRNA2_/TRDRNA2_167118_c0_seq1:109-951(+)